MYKKDSNFIMVSIEVYFKHNSTTRLQRARNDVRSISMILLEFIGAEQIAFRASKAEMTLL